MAQRTFFQNLTAPILYSAQIPQTRLDSITMRGFLIFVFCLWFVFFLGCCLWHIVFCSKGKENLVKDPMDCRLIISAKEFKNKRNQLTPFQSRAKHNEKLRFVFGIENSFTTEDPNHSRGFSDVMRGLMLLQPTQWEELSRDMRVVARRWLDCHSPFSSERIFWPLDNMVQALTLKLIFLTLFSTYLPARNADDSNLVMLADAIDRTWVATKKGCNVPAFKDNELLQQVLSDIFHFDPTDEKNNPMSIILPAFEPIWRAALRIVLELGFHSNPDRRLWKQTLMEFTDRPTRTKFMRAGGNYLVSAENIVNEALRLYPPTRRICRSFQQESEGEITTYAADIEGSHLDAGIWEADSSEFNPLRWKYLTKAQEDAFIPFGASPFLCPARPSFGPRAIGLLAGIILRELRNDWALSEGSDTVHIPEFKGKLSNERDAYRYLFLIRHDE